MRLFSPKTIACAVVLMFSGYLVVEYLTLPDVTFLEKTIPVNTALMRQRDREYADKHNGKAPRHFQTIIPYNTISNSLKTAVLIGEDDAFFEHEGFDYKSIKDAITLDWEKKRFARGASTITQQLAKNLFLSTSKSPLRKIKEAILTYRMEKTLEKRRILEIYLNVIEWGENVYGAESASRYYFAKSAAQLSVNEAVLLASIIPNPRRMNPLLNLKSTQFRRGLLLERMYRYHHITETEYQAALSGPLTFRGTKSTDSSPAPGK